MQRRFDFDLFRLNLVEDEDISVEGKRLTSDDQIRSVFRNMASPKFDVDVSARKTSYAWSCREYCDYDVVDPHGRFSQLVISKSVDHKVGQTVTDAGIESATAAFDPPLADSMLILLWFDRHIAAVEHNSYLASSSWRKGFHAIAVSAAQALGYRTELRLEPVPPERQLLKILESFSKVTRLRVRVRLPNPDLTRITKPLYDKLVEGGIRDYGQDMRNPHGLNRDEGALPHTSVALAQAGYKEGNVVFSGLRDGKRATVTAGKDSARGNTEVLRDFVRGMKANAKAKETQLALQMVMAEIERLCPSGDSSDKLP